MLNLNNQYYTPSIEDLHTNYEFEMINKSVVNREDREIFWQEWIWSFGLIVSTENALRENRIRVPYLTKEQIEAEGWEYTGRATDIWFKKEGSFHSCSGGYKFSEYKIHYGLHDHVLFVEAFFGGESEGKLYEGFCPSINEFRKICKLLNIPKFERPTTNTSKETILHIR